MVVHYMLGSILEMINTKILGIKKCDDSKILTEANDKLLDDTTFEKVVILITFFIKVCFICKFYPQLFLEHTLYIEQRQCKAVEKT